MLKSRFRKAAISMVLSGLLLFVGAREAHSAYICEQETLKICPKPDINGQGIQERIISCLIKHTKKYSPNCQKEAASVINFFQWKKAREASRSKALKDCSKEIRSLCGGASDFKQVRQCFSKASPQPKLSPGCEKTYSFAVKTTDQLHKIWEALEAKNSPTYQLFNFQRRKNQ